MCEHDPLQHFTIIVRLGFGIEVELRLFVVVLGEIKKNGSRLKDDEVVAGPVDEHRNATLESL